MTRILLVRHGETEWNLSNKFQGHRDTPLTPKGERQIACLRDRLKGENIRAAYSSDLGRARYTSNLILEPHHIAPTLDPDLRERNYGKWEGLSLEEVIAREPGLAAEYDKSNPDFAPPGGESVRQVLKRAKMFVLSLTPHLDNRADGYAVLVVGHLGTIRAILMALLGIKPSYFWRLRIALASLSVLETNSRDFALTLFNDTSHLRED